MGGAQSTVVPTVYLTLHPDSSAREVAGFTSGAPLRLTGRAGDTVGLLLDRFNTYRGPTQQVHKVYTEDGAELVRSTVLHTHREAYVRNTSLQTSP